MLGHLAMNDRAWRVYPYRWVVLVAYMGYS